MNLITDLSELREGQLYLIEVMQTEYEYNEETGDGEPVEKKYKFIGTYSGVSEPKVMDKYDGITKLSPEDMEYKYTFNSFQMQISERVNKTVNGINTRKTVIRFDDPYEYYESFPLEIPSEHCLRISQSDVSNNKTKVYLSVHSQRYKQQRTLTHVVESKLPDHSVDINNYTSEFL